MEVIVGGLYVVAIGCIGLVVYLKKQGKREIEKKGTNQPWIDPLWVSGEMVNAADRESVGSKIP